MMRSFHDNNTEQIFKRILVRGLPTDIQHSALRKLLILDAATCLDDLRIPPGNKLEKLSGDRKGQYSIRINEQWRICFVWRSSNAYDIEIVDYH